MPRPNKIWFRKDTGWWMVTIAGNKIRLAKGRNNKKAAQQKFHELMITRHQSPDAAETRVADLIEAFLAYAEKRYSADTYRNYHFYGQKFAEACGQRLTSEIKPFHVTQWVDSKISWNQTTERNARRVAHRVMSWAQEEGLITANPLTGMKCPRANTRKRALAEFVNTRGVPWTSNAIRLAMTRIKKKCGLADDVCSYLIRHTFGTHAVMNGLNSSEVAELMGHTSTEMVDRVYVHLADQVHHLQDAVRRATRPLPKPREDGLHQDGQSTSR